MTYYLYVTDIDGGNDRWFMSAYPNRLLTYAMNNLKDEIWQISNTCTNDPDEIEEGMERPANSVVINLDIQ